MLYVAFAVGSVPFDGFVNELVVFIFTIRPLPLPLVQLTSVEFDVELVNVIVDACVEGALAATGTTEAQSVPTRIASTITCGAFAAVP